MTVVIQYWLPSICCFVLNIHILTILNSVLMIIFLNVQARIYFRRLQKLFNLAFVIKIIEYITQYYIIILLNYCTIHCRISNYFSFHLLSFFIKSGCTNVSTFWTLIAAARKLSNAVSVVLTTLEPSIFHFLYWWTLRILFCYFTRTISRNHRN